MKTKNPIRLYYHVLLTALIASGCSGEKNDFEGPNPKEVNAAYFSGGTASGHELMLLYSGQEWLGKEARFLTSDGERATITLKNVLPGEEYTVLEANLIPSNDSYLFNGEAITSTGCTLMYDGTVRSSLLSLELQVTQPLHSLPGTWNIAPIDVDEETNEIRSVPLRVTWEATGESAAMARQLSTLFSTLGSSNLQQHLQSITFGNDGNITAMYKNNLPESSWMSSPLNLCSYYMKENKLYVSPDIRMITAEQANTREMGAVEIIALLSHFLQWGQEGIPFQLRNNANGSVSVFLNQSTLAPILPLLPVLVEYIPMDEATTGMINGLIEQMTAILPQTTRLEIGIDLTQ